MTQAAKEATPLLKNQHRAVSFDDDTSNEAYATTNGYSSSDYENLNESTTPNHHHHHTAINNNNEWRFKLLKNMSSMLLMNEEGEGDDNETYVTATPEEHAEECDPFTPSHRKSLSTLALAVMVFYNVSGGPFGCEPAIRSAGKFYGQLGFIIFPLLWSIPEALVVAELGAAYPEPSGGVAWVNEAFGTKAAMINGYLNWIGGATDNAIYPVLFLDYVFSVGAKGNNLTALLSEWGGGSASDDNGGLIPMIKIAFTIVIALMLSFINYSGLDIVGQLSIIICIVSMSPFLLLSILGLPKVQPSRWFTAPEISSSIDMFVNTTIGVDDIDVSGGGGGIGIFSLFSFIPSMKGILWRPFLNNLFWNLNSFDGAASMAGEVKDPGTVFPRAMLLAVIFVILAYIIPLAVATGASDSSQDQWTDGYLATVASNVIGPWLGHWTVFAAGISNLALFEAEMSSDSYMVMGMARRGLLPKVLATTSQHGTPTYGIMLGTAVIVAMSVADFEAIVEIFNFAYSLSLLLEFAAFIKLRITHDHVPRPYRVPMGTMGCILMLAPPFITIVILMSIASRKTYLYIVAVILFGLLFHYIQKIAKSKSWCEYEHGELYDFEKLPFIDENATHLMDLRSPRTQERRNSSFDDDER